MARGAALLFDLIAKDGASPAFLKVAGAADKASAATLRAEKGIATSSAAMSRAGSKLTKTLTLPLLAVGAVSIAQASKYQKSLNVIAVATDQTSQQMQASSKGLMTIAKSTGTSLDQLTTGLYTVEKGGLRGQKALDAVKAAAQGAKAEGADLGTVTNALTSIMASYGSKLSNPVAAMNMIIKGSGLAKTSLQDFSSSLSTVVPVAASLGISFDQVAGAIDTMTQHGETAQAATDNLRNLITNLAGQNNVASQSLQQLGVNTVDLSKNLGKRGLTGSLDIVLAAINKHGKDGMIVTSSFKQAATATGSLKTELDAMPKTMQANAKAFDSGTMGYKDFLAYSKSLGGQQYALAKNFISTEQTARGFSNTLKSGNGNVRTLASTLQKSLGGVTGMNVALQLSGESADKFHTYVKQVGDAAKTTGGDVLGWAKTQDTFANKVDRAKYSLQVLSVEIGSALIPAVSKIVSGVGKAVGWFDKLSGTDKKIIGWSAVVLAGLGPVLSIGARIGSAGAGLAKFAGASEASASRVGLAAQRISGALAGIGLVYAGTQTTGAKSHILGLAGGALAGASIGSFFGPIGTAVGGVAGAVGGLSLSFLKSGQSARKGTDQAKQALKEQQASAADLLSTLQSVNGAYNDQYKQQLTEKLRKNGALGGAQAAGVAPSTVLNAALGDSSAVKTLNALKSKLATQTGSLVTADGVATDPSNPRTGTADQVKQYAALVNVMHQLGIETPSVANAEKQFELVQRTLHGTIVPASLLAGGAKNLSKEFVGLGTSLDTTSGYGMRNTAIIQENANQLAKNADKQLVAGKSVDSVTTAYGKNYTALRTNLLGLGFLPGAVDKVLGKYRQMPATVLTATGTSKKELLALASLKITPKISADPSRAQAVATRMQTVLNSLKQNKIPGITANSKQGQAVIADLQRRINNLQGKTVGITIAAAVNSVLSAPKAKSKPITGGIVAPSGKGTGRASGGGAPEGYFSVNERGPEIFHKQGNRLDIMSNSQSKEFVAKTGMKFPGFAGGTVNGVKYTTTTGYDNAKARAAKKKDKSNADTVSTAISGIGQAYNAPFSVADTGFARTRQTIASAISTLNAQIAKGLKASTAAGFRRQISSLVGVANKQLGSLRLNIKSSDLSALKAGVKSTVDDTRTALSQMLTDLTRSGAGAAALTAVRVGGNRLVSLQGSLATQKDQLSAMTDYRSGISDTLKGGFDPTQSGSITDLLAGFSGATGKNNTYTSEVSGLLSKAKGDKTLTAFINQLDASGDSATLDSLSHGSKADLASVSKAVGLYNSSVARGADAATTGQYGGVSVAQQQKNITAIQKQLDDTLSAVGQVVALLPKISFNLEGKPIDAKIDKHDAALLKRLEHALSKGGH